MLHTWPARIFSRHMPWPQTGAIDQQAIQLAEVELEDVVHQCDGQPMGIVSKCSHIGRDEGADRFLDHIHLTLHTAIGLV